MKYFKEETTTYHQHFAAEGYKIPLEELVLIRPNQGYAIYCEGENLFLLTHMSIEVGIAVGNCYYVRPYGKVKDLETLPVAQIDRDAYNFWMTMAH